jgi:hypothetical protein
MKTNRTLNPGLCQRLVFLRVLASVVLSLQIPLLAQDPETTGLSQEAGSVVSGEAVDSSTAVIAQPVRLNVADLVEAAPVGTSTEGEAVVIPANVPQVVAYYLPKQDTNASIGIHYPAGTPEFAYLVAGIRPPGGDPRLPPDVAVEPVVVVAAPPEPLVFYERPEAGSKALMMRATIPTETSTLDQTHSFPPGAFVRGASVGTIASPGASVPRPRGVVFYRDTATTVGGKDLVRDFPPGATLWKGTPGGR